jgi:hypothetical protein
VTEVFGRHRAHRDGPRPEEVHERVVELADTVRLDALALVQAIDDLREELDGEAQHSDD